MIRRLALCAALAAFPATAQDFGLSLPQGSRQLTERIRALDSYDLPTGVWANGAVPVRTLEGRVEKRSWRISVGSKTTLQILAPLRDQILEAGFDLLLDCAAQTCGGFDFRFATEVIPSPDMYVAVRDYRFLSAMRGDEALSLLVSRNPPDAYVQLVQVFPRSAPEAEDETVVAPAPVQPAPPIDMMGRLQTRGRVILSGLDFETGAGALGEGPFDTLGELAQILAADPALNLALVGHTDNVGSLESNIDLSRRRAEAVRDRLVEQYGIAPDRLQAQGAGYLAPIASNLTPEGRDANRRVEAVLLAPQP
ncbi:OmpA family protein [Ruegeria marina]|uniref:OmpA-OmpF porin, OOP family n=1 Tax=Ruegeria marina TaxID=639004 RepID=A0A1G6WXH2_9RHOB|nr:OmpA family protein [Ruegeria marina]SDD69705.1 OmpA-OmpF porin, OOP family [Ruegeria marina]